MWINFEGSFADFCKKEKNNPGTLIEVLINGKKKQFLIGDVSAFGSVMNGDCLLLETTPVLKYQIIWYRWR